MNEHDLAGILLAHLVSEKSVSAEDTHKRFVFKVKKTAKKHEIKKAVEGMLHVEVDSVQTLNVKGKKKRFGRTVGKRSDWKKAYVKLKPGHDIEFSTL